MIKLLICLCIIYVIFSFLPQPQQYESVDVKMCVAKDDTVWTLVEKAMVQVDDDRYILNIIEETLRINNLNSNDIGNLPIGSVLVVPCKRKVRM